MFLRQVDEMASWTSTSICATQNCHDNKVEDTNGHVKRLGRRFRALFFPCFSDANRTMTPYEFEVLKDGVVIDIQSIHLPHIRFAWPEIIRLAKRFCGPGHKFRVKDDAGGIVILTGVDTVRRHTGNED